MKHETQTAAQALIDALLFLNNRKRDFEDRAEVLQIACQILSKRFDPVAAGAAEDLRILADAHMVRL